MNKIFSKLKRKFPLLFNIYQAIVFLYETIILFFIKSWTLIQCSFSHKNKLNQEKRKDEIIVSLTTIPSRINSASLVIWKMLNQTVKPDRIILNLSHEEFDNIKLPKLIEKEKKLGLEVFYCENIKPHKKYYYTLLNNPEAIIITIDDDCIYSKNLIEKLYNSYIKHPNCISCIHCIEMKHENGELLPYNDWGIATETDKPRYDYFAVGIGGVLYPPHVLHKEIFNIDNIKKLCINGDDIWLKTMEIMNNTPVVLVKLTMKFKYIPTSQKEALWKSNLNHNKNDIQLKAVFSTYNDFYGKSDTLYNRIFKK